MIEAVAKVAESANTFSKASEAFNPDARITSPEKNTTQKAETQKTQPDIKQYDPDRRVEAPQDLEKKDTERYDPDKRIEQKKESVETVETKEAEQSESISVSCRNESLEGQEHPETGVPFKRKTVENDKGEKVEGVFPEFESDYDVQLPENLEKASDAEQFAECNKQLKDAVEKNPKLAEKFTPEQLEQIKNRDTPDGYTWHHNEEKGKMQLVDSDTHTRTGHTGGKAIWGGGSENR